MKKCTNRKHIWLKQNNLDLRKEIYTQNVCINAHIHVNEWIQRKTREAVRKKNQERIWSSRAVRTAALRRPARWARAWMLHVLAARADGGGRHAEHIFNPIGEVDPALSAPSSIPRHQKLPVPSQRHRSSHRLPARRGAWCWCGYAAEPRRLAQ